MSNKIQWSLFGTQNPHRQAAAPSAGSAGEPYTCPVCGSAIEAKRMGKKEGWTCLVGGYAHYFQAQYGHLEQWFTSGEGNGREPLIKAMNHAA